MFLTGSSPTATAAPKEQIVGSNTRACDSIYKSTGVNDTRLEVRRIVNLGGAPISYIRLIYPGWYLSIAGNHGGAEVALPNSYILEASVEYNSTLVGFSFNEQSSFQVQPNGGIISDAITAAQLGLSAIPAGAQIFIKDSVLVAPGQNIPYVSSYTAGTGEGMALSSAATSQVLTPGPISVPSGGSSTIGGGGALSPLIAVVGHANSPMVSLYMVGDSLDTFQNDVNGSGTSGANGGIWVRPAWNVGGVNLPWANVARGGASFSGCYRGSANRILLAQWATHVVMGLGTNDINGGFTPASILSQAQIMWASFKSMGVKRVEQRLIVPRLSADSDNFTTLVGQTVSANFVTGGNADILNTDFINNVGSNGLDAVVDLRAVLADAVQTDHWAVNGTPNWMTDDGTHPSTVNGVAAAAAVIAARYATYTP